MGQLSHGPGRPSRGAGPHPDPDPDPDADPGQRTALIPGPGSGFGAGPRRQPGGRPRGQRRARAAGPVAERARGQPGHPLDGEQPGQLAGERLEQHGPGQGQAAADDHEPAVQDALAPGQRPGERADRFVPCLPGGRITGRHQADHAGGAGDLAAGQFAVPAGHRRGRGHRLQAAGAAAAAPAAAGHGHVADLAAERVRARVGPAVQHERRGDPGARLDQEEVTRPGGRAEAGLGPGRGPHVVAEGHGQAEPPSSRSASGTSCQPMLAANRATPAASSTIPGTARPSGGRPASRRRGRRVPAARRRPPAGPAPRPRRRPRRSGRGRA